MNNNIPEQTKETLLILQEECAEVTQAISKIFRFGFDSCWPHKNSPDNTAHLEEEIGDLFAMVEILFQTGIISAENVDSAKIKKKQKLSEWSNIDVK